MIITFAEKQKLLKKLHIVFILLLATYYFQLALCNSMQASHIRQKMGQVHDLFQYLCLKKVLNSVPCIDIFHEGHIIYEVI